MSRKLVCAVVVAALVLLAALMVAPDAGAATRAPAGDAFYVPPKPLVKAKPGTIIRSTPIANVPAGARAWKVLYHSRAVDGKDIAVSGVVVAPTGKAPRGGRVVVTWAVAGVHADQCAPSKQPDIASGTSGAGIGYPRALIPMLQTFLDAGYVVAATDYEGLGTPGPHPALVGESEGRGVLDAARAARGLKAAAAGSDALVFGLSGGGPGALFAGELAASYAPDLRVLGITAVAPATNNEIPFQVLATGSAFNGLIVSLVESFHAAYPAFDPAALLTPDALAKAAVFDEKCDIGPTFANDSVPALAHNPLDTPALAAILHTNSAGNRPAGAPLLVVQGTADQVTQQFLTDAFVAKACGAGDTVDYRLYTGATHGDPELNAASNDIAAWFADRVSGAPATSTCT
jgi:alpha-beta hydrolase superfamily lysophospholipase